MMPYILWVLTVETSLMSSNDQSFEASFGQVSTHSCPSD
jgi:hypothetical protein